MGLLSTLGTIGGSLFGGPVGGAIGGALGGLVEGNDQAAAARQAAQTANAGTQSAIDLQRRMYEEGVARQKPFLEMGTNALNRLNALNQPGANVAQFLTMDPGYGFRLSEGQKALERSAAARGGLLSGATGKALTRFGQDYGSQEFTNAYNRLAGIANLGPSAAGVMNNLGSGYGQSAGAGLMNQGYTTGNALLAGANARQSMYGNIGSALGQVTPGQWSSAGNALSNWYNNLGNTNVPGGSSWGMDLGQG